MLLETNHFQLNYVQPYDSRVTWFNTYTKVEDEHQSLGVKLGLDVLVHFHQEWLEAVVIGHKKTRVVELVKIHYKEFLPMWDEWIPYGSVRLRLKDQR